jgi:hypothetical protein
VLAVVSDLGPLAIVVQLVLDDDLDLLLGERHREIGLLEDPVEGWLLSMRIQRYREIRVFLSD